jgi:hypothetical protein
MPEIAHPPGGRLGAYSLQQALYETRVHLRRDIGVPLKIQRESREFETQDPGDR